MDKLENGNGASTDAIHGKYLSDIDLVNCGLTPISAFVRTDKTKNAIRVQHSRQKAAEQGIRQINVRARPEVHPLLKAIAHAEPAALPELLRKKLNELEHETKLVQPGPVVPNRLGNPALHTAGLVQTDRLWAWLCALTKWLLQMR